MKRSFLLFPIVMFPAAALSAAEDLRRAGLFSSPDFTSAGNEWVKVSDGGWICGYAYPKSGSSDQAAWVTSPVDDLTRRIGLFADPEFTVDGYRISTVTQLTTGGWIGGYSKSPLPTGNAVDVPWLANGTSGITFRLGLTSQEFTYSPDGMRISTMKKLTESGCAWGVSSRFAGSAMTGQAVWVVDGTKGTSFRVGLFTGADTTDTGRNSQDSDGYQLTNSGWLSGSSSLYQGALPLGNAIWVADAATGTTRRMGFFTGASYVSSSGNQRSSVAKLTENGWIGGTSDRFKGADYTGTAAWVANVTTGSIRRLGFFEGARYTDKYDGGQESTVTLMTESGWISGWTDLYDNGESGYGKAAWVANTSTNTIRRVGLFGGTEFNDRARETSYTERLTESGWACGQSNRYHAGSRGGSAVWVADAATGTTRRVGLTGDGFTSSGGNQESRILGITESGWLTGYSIDYRNAQGVLDEMFHGSALWAAEAVTGITRRVGLTGPEFIGSDGNYGGGIEGITEAGLVFGYSRRLKGTAENGTATWVADAASGKTTRLGLTGPDFTRASDNQQESKIEGWTQSGFVRGTATLYKNGTTQEGIPWVADAKTGKTFKPGLSGGVYTSSGGFESSRINFLTEAGLAGGQSTKTGATFGDGATAWVFNIKTGTRTDFDLSVPPQSRSSFSWIQGITPQGIVYGSYRFFKNNTSYDRTFLWAEGLGTLLLDEDHPPTGISGAQKGEFLSNATVNSQGLVVGNSHQGVYYGNIQSLVPPAPDLRVTGLTKLTGGKYRLGYSTDIACRITVPTSTDLTNWQDLNTLNATPGSANLELSASLLQSQQYWRLKTAP